LISGGITTFRFGFIAVVVCRIPGCSKCQSPLTDHQFIPLFHCYFHCVVVMGKDLNNGYSPGLRTSLSVAPALCLPSFDSTSDEDGVVVFITSQAPIPSHQSRWAVPCQSFCDEIRGHVLHGTILDVDCALFDVVPDEVELDVDVLRFKL
jgi:hypothetical protein